MVARYLVWMLGNAIRPLGRKSSSCFYWEPSLALRLLILNRRDEECKDPFTLPMTKSDIVLLILISTLNALARFKLKGLTFWLRSPLVFCCSRYLCIIKIHYTIFKKHQAVPSPMLYCLHCMQSLSGSTGSPRQRKIMLSQTNVS